MGEGADVFTAGFEGRRVIGMGLRPTPLPRVVEWGCRASHIDTSTPQVSSSRPEAPRCVRNRPFLGIGCSAAGALRKERGLTQQQLADALGMSQSVVAYYERRADNPSLELLQKLAAFYEVPVTQLVDDGPAKIKREKPGPTSALEECLEKVRKLPRREQSRIIEMIDVAVESARRRTA